MCFDEGFFSILEYFKSKKEVKTNETVVKQV